MPVIRTQVLVAASFIISITVAVFGGFGVPVLPVMGLFFIIGQYKYIKIVDNKSIVKIIMTPSSIRVNWIIMSGNVTTFHILFILEAFLSKTYLEKEGCSR